MGPLGHGVVVIGVGGIGVAVVLAWATGLSVIDIRFHRLPNRLTLGGAEVLVTTAAAYRHKIAPARDTLPSLRHVLVTGPGRTTYKLGDGPAASSASSISSDQP